MIRFLKKQPPGRLIALGFAAVILIGSALLMLPISIRPGVEVAYIDALFTSTSAVCVTGLIAVDAYDNFTVFGQAVLAGLIQIGGLGVTSVGVGLILAAGRRVSIKGRSLVKEALNVDSFQGMVRLIQWVLKVTLCFEGAGAVLSFLTFSQDYPLPRALWTSVFHSVAAFNNSGFDILGGMQNLIPYQSDVLLNLVTCALIIFGGLGFLVMLDIRRAGSFRKLTFHSKVVITTTAALLIAGTLLLKATEDMTWLGAFFHSVSARTAGFSTYSMGELTNAGLFTLILLMFIGASPGSTGGGIKTTTFFALMQQVRAVFTKKKPGGFHRTLPGEAIDKAGVIALLSVVVVCVGTFLLCVLEPELDFVRLLFEEVSAFGTVGLSTGITPDLSVASKLVLIFTMYIGRLGAFTLFSLWIDRPDPSIRYTEEMITIG
ncbi:TrkH family potassium uptake protein [Pseudoflavonifractor sp. An184]|uniref:TrkH family potassium uptake protein n=1 Tax=Pseudoflavonifractor sp. An184 TaxID=1965576 RepID=UPI000B368B44|nr:TrkH family potassium uptake protein [Pseudoflavonifractor sp. An184]MBS5547583.1 TrkH family potassium uptake protein [Oscillospiraceae bacterium]OUP53040.1 H(+)-transporting ATPase [Pseudoflavonifractor sp. An184]